LYPTLQFDRMLHFSVHIYSYIYIGGIDKTKDGSSVEIIAKVTVPEHKVQCLAYMCNATINTIRCKDYSKMQTN